MKCSCGKRLTKQGLIYACLHCGLEYEKLISINQVQVEAQSNSDALVKAWESVGCSTDIVDIKVAKIWGAMCGKWGAHGSGTCPQIKKPNSINTLTE